MTRRMHVAYLLVFSGLLAVGFFIEASWWTKALIGIAAMMPVVIADIVTTKRRHATRAADSGTATTSV